ncbi:transporter substrate-binding domain-containing protein [Alteromonas sp. ASW11-36]|uniref:Transporter substrate-binding domain-containing protein n=1 Tax=Alteromonas arenosi TaxID=3055817 RepID=A0ABT7SS39_9ALTE|nr:transporter substrate-binding domain-containing protein [Alteromonas sp. ASW11-36]MDM7859003.1 transporter substrate-binding domain-containing protein [Alteromonas sp. ASW11-36]
MRVFRRWVWFGLSIYGLLHLSAAAQEQAVLPVLTSPLPVFSEERDNGRMTGYSVEYAREVLAIAGFQPDITPLPFARLMRRMEEGELAVATGVGRTPEREDKFYWLAPMTANVIGLYSKQRRTIISFDELTQPISVAVLRGDYRSELLSGNEMVNLAEFNTWEQALGAVLKDRVDAIFFSDLGIAITCKNNNFDCSALEKIYTHDVLISYMAMLKTDSNRDVANRLSKAAAEFVKSRDFLRVANRWVPQLQLISSEVQVTEGVVVLGKIGTALRASNPLWVITNLEPLFSVRDERGQLTGYAVELVRSILLEAGMQTEILSAPWQRILVESEMKSDVLVFSLARTAEREDNFHWLTPITQNAYSVFQHGDVQTEASNLSELPDKSKIVTLKGDFRADLIEQAGHTLVAGESWADVMQRFIDRDGDYLFLSDGGIEVLCSSSELDCSGVVKSFTYQLGTTYLAISKQGTTDTLIERLTDAAKTFKASAQYQRLVDYWLADYRQKSALNMHEHEGVIRLWSDSKDSLQ